jgi:thiamine biosynthesis protein ThiS
MLYINQQPSAITASNLAELAQALLLPPQGIALVLNQQILPRALWQHTLLPVDGDQHIEIFQLVAGG